jgi:hypothetical protein
MEGEEKQEDIQAGSELIFEYLQSLASTGGFIPSRHDIMLYALREFELSKSSALRSVLLMEREKDEALRRMGYRSS